MNAALFINGAFEANLIEIIKAQRAFPKIQCYLQPYTSHRIKLLRKSKPTPEKPITLYLSLTHSLNQISYRAKIVGWQDKRELAQNQKALALLNQHIKKYQPDEKEIYLSVSDGTPCVNLIAVVDVERFGTPIPVSCFIKTSDGKPLKTRTRSGHWAVVFEQDEWLGKDTQVTQDYLDSGFRDEIKNSLSDSHEARRLRLAKANKQPESIQVISRAFKRNADVVAEVLLRANGTCEKCYSPAPFLRASDDTPYLEVHHIVQLSAGGEDTDANAMALCPNCHRKFHFGK